ncbi:V-type ATP synthase subunit F [Candidatus Falkowbacteria bacterium]|nr:V-type ATP synthase subunit F [Candidatus Falkowbacteria bacterium]
MKIAILGTTDSILGLKAVGLTPFGVYTQEEAEKAIDEVYSGDYGILFITEDWMPKLENKLDEVRGEALPAVIAVPSSKGATGAGMRDLRKIVEQAVGSDILFNE